MTLTGNVAAGKRRMDDDGQSRSEVMRRLTRQEIIYPQFWSKVQSTRQEQPEQLTHTSLEK